jgi:uncharacterized protein (TIGR02996 family)
VLLAASEPAAAVAVVEQLAADSSLPAGVETRMLLSQLAQQLRQPELALKLAKAAVATDPESAPALLWQGHVALRSGDREAARAAFEHAVSLAPDDKATRLTYAALLNEIGEPAAAASTLAEVAADDEVLAARAAYAARSADKALLQRVARELEALPGPRPAARIELLGQLAELADDPQEALRWYRDVPRGEQWLDAQLRIAVLLDTNSSAKAALAHLDTLRAGGIEDDGKLADTFLLEAELLGRHDDQAASIDALGKGLVVLPDERRLLYARALLFEKLDRIAECEADLRRVVELHPDDPDALNALGYTLADRTTRFDEAFALIDKALKLKPDEPAIIDSMGWVEYRRGNLAAAIGHLRRAYGIQPDVEIGAHLGEVLWASGERAQAREVWAAARALEAGNDVLEETVKRLDR